MLRPFFLLVTMTPRERAALGATLGIPTYAQSHAVTGDKLYPHKEAWYLINCHHYGIQARTNYLGETLTISRNSCWYEVLERTCRGNFKTVNSAAWKDHLKLQVSKAIWLSLEVVMLAT
jgi:hypothetical protein